MNRFFNYYNSLCVGANSPNVFSFDPYIIAIKEMLVSELRQMVFYIEKLKDLDVDMSVYRDKVIEFISVLVVNLDFKKESFFVIVEDLYENKTKLQEMYGSICIERGLSPEYLSESEIKLEDKDSIIKALNEYEQNLSIDFNSFSINKKILYQIMVNLVLNACNCLIDLKNYGVNFVEAKEEVLKLFNVSNSISSDETEWIKKIKDFAKCNYKIIKLLNEKIIEKYGPIQKSVVPFSTKKGKAILVSGYNFSDLEKIIKAVSDYGISVYTHHEMINAFKYEKFSTNSKLVGHFQRSSNNFSLDFSSFPGAIYISKNSTPKIDVIRGQIYSSAKYPSFGIAKIENNDFSEMINYSLNAEGFKQDTITTSITIGYDVSEMNKIIDDIVDKFKEGTITHISIIGNFDKFSKSNSYIQSFFEKASSDFFIISFSYSSDRDNFWQAGSYFDFSLVYLLLDRLMFEIPNSSKNISIFLTDCSMNTISHTFNLMYLGVSKIFLGSCCPNIINPILFDGLKNLFSIKEISSPQDDINQVLK